MFESIQLWVNIKKSGEAMPLSSVLTARAKGFTADVYPVGEIAFAENGFTNKGVYGEQAFGWACPINAKPFRDAL